MNGKGLASLFIALGVALNHATAQDMEWSPTRTPPVIASSSREAWPAPAAAVSLGRPRVVGTTDPVVVTPPIRIDQQLAPVAYNTTPAPTWPHPTGAYSAGAATNHTTYRGQAPDVPPPASGGGSIPVPPPYTPPPPPTGNEIYNNGAITGSNPGFWDKCRNFCSADNFGSWCGFQSDHCELDYFSSPITSPFLSEDPRALTEVKPVFMYQKIPGSNPGYGGGNAEFFGLQARVAFTQRLSLVVNKLGWVGLQSSSDNPPYVDANGFSEIWLGPKYTFWRDESCGRAAAVGLTFQIPSGDKKVFQDTGSLTLAPYLSFGQSFWRTSYGTFNYMSTTGYAFSTDNQRSDYFYSNFHLDYDVLSWHKFYPMIELNWTRYTTAGTAQPAQTFEGGDLINFGAGSLSNKNYATLATGMRYKFSEAFQLGGAIEFPVSGNKNMMDYRLTFDLILRY